MNTPKICFNWFTFSGDAALLIESVRSVARVFPGAALRVWDDANSPIALGYLDALKQYAPLVEYNKTSFPRRGNLNGLACVAGMLECFDKIPEIGLCNWQVKIDCDCILSGKNILDNLFEDKGVDAFFFTMKEKNCGFFYAISNYFLHTIKNISWRELIEIPILFPENLVIQKLAIASQNLNSDSLVSVANIEFIRSVEKNGELWAGWSPVRPVDFWEKYNVICTGNVYPGQEKELARKEAALAMKKFNDDAENK